MVDDRAQSVGIAAFFTSLIGGAIVYYVIVFKFGNEIYALAQRDGSGQVATQGTEWLWTAGSQLMPLAFILVASFGLLIYAVYQRAVIG